MKDLNIDVVKVSRKKNRFFLYVGLLFLLVGLFVFYKGYVYENNEYPTPVSFYDLKMKSGNKKNVGSYSYLDINTTPSLFAVYENNGHEESKKFYFVMDSASNLYILYMDDDTFLRLSNKNLEDEPVRVYGIVNKMKNDIRKTAISTYNKVMKDEYLNDENFEKYVGNIYLDLNQKYYDGTYYYLGSLAFLISFLVFLIVYFRNFFNNRKVLKECGKELVKINRELNSKDVNKLSWNGKFDGLKSLYLTKNYVVRLGSNLLILRYKDIEFVYPCKFYQNGLLVGIGLCFVTASKKYDVKIKAFGKKKSEDFVNDLLEKLKMKDKKIDVRYNGDFFQNDTDNKQNDLKSVGKSNKNR